MLINKLVAMLSGNCKNLKTINKMDSRIAFIGGIYGVGKSTIYRHLSSELKLEYLSTSELLKWKDINEDSKGKKVKDIPDTQNRLIFGLTNIVQKRKYYLLDGHYCLLNSNNEVVNVPLEIFEKINPFSLNLIVGDIAEIKKRLETRDDKPYDYELLERLQNQELIYAKQLSKKLGVTLNIGNQNDYPGLLFSLRSFFLKSENEV